MTFCHMGGVLSSSEKLPPKLDGNKYIESQRDDVHSKGPYNTKWDVSINSLLSGLRELCRRGGANIVRARGDGGHQGNKTF